MIDPENLRTASLYINNQLLSRGLLRDGQSIDFANPEESEGGIEAAMGCIISVVNDLILRRDRDAEHRESLSSTLRALRADVQRQTTEAARQTEKLSDAQRRLDIAEATERALRTQLKGAEMGIHKLKEEMARMKALVAQARGACANEVRKRDRQIDSLKKAVADGGRVRGGGRSRDVVTICVTGEFDGEGEGGGMPVGATEDAGYSLRMETTGFLTELVKGLSEENEGLLALVKRTVDGLREMSGLDRNAERSHGAQDELVMQMQQKSAEELAAELEAIVEHLRSILTNPSFVPIEEVEVRDEAIGRLRAGLETMEARWKDAVHMMDGWRRRMVASGKAVDVEDLQMGLRLSPVRVRDVEETASVEPMRLPCVQEEDEEEEEGYEEEEEEVEEDVGQYDGHQDKEPEPPRLHSQSPAESLRLVPAPSYNVEELGDDSDSDSSIFQDDIDMDDLDVEEPNVQILQISTADSMDSSPLPEPPQISPLKDSYSSGNRGATHNRKRPGDFTTIAEENTSDLVTGGEKKAPASSSHASKPTSPNQKSRPSSPPREDEDALPSYTASYDSPLFGKSGERPSQAQLGRKLFSKPPGQTSEKRPRSVGASISPNQSRDGKESPPLARTTRSSGRKSPKTSPAASQAAAQATQRMVRGVEVDVASMNAPIAAAASPPISTTTSISTRTTTQQKQAVESTIQNKSANSSSSSLSSSAADTKYRNRSPVRPTQLTPAAAPSTSGGGGGGSRLPRRNAQQQQSPLNMATIAAKLAASEREADAARVRAKLKAVRRSRRISGMAEKASQEQEAQQEQVQEKKQTPRQERAKSRTEKYVQAPPVEIPEAPQEEEQYQHPYPGTMAAAEEDVDPVKKDRNPSPVKKRGPRRRWSRGYTGPEDVDELAALPGEEKEEESDRMEMGIRLVKRRAGRRTSKVASRRRSTLSPWELQGLISGNVGGAESPAR
ncbi:Afadin and alpha-actinin-binding-domain-containing protein [Hypoxylon argillaceum]|nr:Afadin and alpha-actinin-binding-domain-containing protein [Hypoxylon argillaceum]